MNTPLTEAALRKTTKCYETLTMPNHKSKLRFDAIVLFQHSYEVWM